MTNETSQAVVINGEEENKAVAPVQSDQSLTTLKAETLISQAITSGVPVETMERLLAMRKDLKAEFAKEEFDKAMAKFQRDCPTIVKNKSVFERDGKKVRYKFASLDSIVEQTKQTISDCGLSYTIRTKSDEKMFTAIIKVAHIAGHSEDSEFSIPISSEQFMSDVQKFGARSTFAKRYAFLNAFGIMTGDEDSERSVESNEAKTTNADQLKNQTNEPVLITMDQGLELEKELKRTGKQLAGLLAHVKKETIMDLTYQEAKIWITSLKAQPNAPTANSKTPAVSGESDFATGAPVAVEGEIIETMPPKEVKKPAPKSDPLFVPPATTEEPGPMRKAYNRTQEEKAKKAEVSKGIPGDVCKLINLYSGVPQAEWPEGLRELNDDCNTGKFKGKEAYPLLF